MWTNVTRRSRRPSASPTKAWSALCQPRYISKPSTVGPHHASPGRQTSGMDGTSVKPTTGWGMDWVWHPVNTPQGLPPAAPRVSGKPGLKFSGMLPPGHRVVGLRQIDGMPQQAQRASVVRQQQGITIFGPPPCQLGAGACIGRD
jgi:hypothetical protein